VNTLYCLEVWRGEQRISPPWDNFNPRGKNSTLGDKFAPGVKVAPRGKVKNGPLGVSAIETFFSSCVNELALLVPVENSFKRLGL
jgi:hypothetical protein